MKDWICSSRFRPRQWRLGAGRGAWARGKTKARLAWSLSVVPLGSWNRPVGGVRDSYGIHIDFLGSTTFEGLRASFIKDYGRIYIVQSCFQVSWFGRDSTELRNDAIASRPLNLRAVCGYQTTASPSVMTLSTFTRITNQPFGTMPNAALKKKGWHHQVG